MILKTLEVSLSKEERRIVDEYGNTASTWARIGITAELDEGDLPENCIQLLKTQIQPQVDDWLLNQGGYASATGAQLAQEEDIKEMLDDVFGDEPYKISIVESNSPNSVVGDADADDIPL